MEKLFLSRLIQWLQAHPLVVSFTLFAIGCAVSIYSSDIRRFIREYPKTKLRQNLLNRAEERFKLLNWVHGNPYNLNLFLYSVIVDSLWWAFVIQTLIIGVISILRSHGIASHPSWTPFFGYMFGTGLRIREILKELRAYDSSTQRLQREIERFRGTT